MSWSVRVPWLPPGLNGNRGLIRAHFRTRKKWAEECCVLTQYHGQGPAGTPLPRFTGPVRVIYTRHYARRWMDWDNCAASCKVPLDALVRLGVLEDDSPAQVAELLTRQEKVPTVKEEGFSIRIEPLEP